MKRKKTERKQIFNKKRIIAVLVVFVLIAIMVFSNPEVQKFLLASNDVKISVRAGTNLEPVLYGNEMLLVGGDGILAIDKAGKESWSVVAPVTSPAVSTKNDYIMLADLNGTAVNVYEKDKLVSQIKTEREILSAKLNKNGYVATATGELGYKGAVTVYDKSGKEAYKWYSGSGYIGDIDLSPNNKLAAAQLMTDGEKLYSRIMLVDIDSDEEAECIAEIDGIVMKLKFKDNGGLIAVSEGGVYAFKKSGKEDFVIDFGGRTPVDCNIENKGNMVFAFDSGLNNTIFESYSAGGKLRGSYETDGEMIDFDVNGETIVSVTANGITRSTPSGKVKSHIEASSAVKKIKLFSGRDKALTLGSGSVEIIKIR